MSEIGVHARGLPGLPDDHAKIPVWNAENWFYEDFAIGDKIRSIRRTIAEGEKPLRTPLLIAMRVLLTLAIEGLVFYLFGYREKRSWRVFFIANLVTQTGLNLLFHGISLGYMWAIVFYPLEMLIAAIEAKVYCGFITEKSKKMSILCAVVANLLSMLCGGYIISHLPI